MPIKDLQIYISYTDVAYPKNVRMALRYYNIFLKYSYIKSNNWTGIGVRRKKLTRIIERAHRLAKRSAAKQAGLCQVYKFVKGEIDGKFKILLYIYTPDSEK